MCVFVCVEAFEVELLLWLLSEYICGIKWLKGSILMGNLERVCVVCVYCFGGIVLLLVVSEVLFVLVFRHLYEKSLRMTLKWNKLLIAVNICVVLNSEIF